MSDVKSVIASTIKAIYLIEKDHLNSRHKIYDELILLHRGDACEKQQEYTLKIILSKLREHETNKPDNFVRYSTPSEIADNIEKYPQAWGLAGPMLSDEILGIDSSKARETKPDKDVPIVNVGKAGGSRAAGVPAVVDLDSEVVKSRTSRSKPIPL